MSHFTCLVIGHDVDQLMEKYDEQNEENFERIEDTNDTFMTNWYNRILNPVDKDDVDTKKRFLEKTENNGSIEAFIEFVGDHYSSPDDKYKMSKFDENRISYYIVKDGKILAYVYFNNPNAKYDWYTEGGRWDGILMKDGSLATYGEIGNIDIDTIINEKKEKLGKAYDDVISFIGHIPSVIPWSEYSKRAMAGEISWEDARFEYYEQEDCKKFSDYCRDNGPFMDKAEEYACSREAYVSQANLPVFCANINGDWFEEGEIGWFACVNNKKEPISWAAELIGRIKLEIEKNPHQEFTFLDCHI